MNPYWISFVNNHKNMGCCIIDADDPEQALEQTNKLGINPGGQAMVYCLEPDAIDLKFWEKNKLISPEELEASGYEKIGEEGRDQLSHDPRATMICEDCNQ